MNRDKVDIDINAERERQNAMWGEQTHDPFVWLAILGEEVGEVNNAVIESFNFDLGYFNDKQLEHVREEAIQVAAVAKAFVECLDRTYLEK